MQGGPQIGPTCAAVLRLDKVGNGMGQMVREYTVITILSNEMAIGNARLIQHLDSDWLTLALHGVWWAAPVMQPLPMGLGQPQVEILDEPDGPVVEEWLALPAPEERLALPAPPDADEAQGQQAGP